MLKGKHAARLFPIPYSGLYFFYFRVDRPPMEDPDVRRALLQATDMGKAVQAVFGDGQTAAYGIIPPTLEGYRNPRPYFSPTEARESLAASTYRTADRLPPISIAVGSNLPEYVRLSEHVQRLWQDVLGVRATVVPMGGAADARVQGAQVFRASLGTIIHDTSAAVSALGLSSANFMKQNVGAQNDALDALLSQADALPLSRQSERVALYQEAEKILLREAYYVPITWVQYYHAVKPWVRNYAANNDLSLYTLPRMYIARHVEGGS
jgi:oligopeptide transport system substrate-binding protein